MIFQGNVPLSATACRAISAVLAAMLLAGCSQDYVSYDDMRVQNTAEERFPISVVDEPVKMNVAATHSRLSPEQVNGIVAFARQAEANGASSISILYASGNPAGRSVAGQVAHLLAAQGIARSHLSTAAYTGSSHTVTLSYDRQVARTTDCGDWSQNMAGNQYNELYPNYGCALQNNFAAMVEDPADFLAPRGLAPATGASRAAVIGKYNTGDWSQKQQEFPDAATTQPSQ